MRDLFAPFMFVGLILALLPGFPVAFTLMGYGLFCGFLAIQFGYFTPEFLAILPHNVFGILSNELLLAVPFFTLMGSILEKCGLAEDMLDSMGKLFGRIKGGLGYSVIIVGFILGAITGTVAGQVIAMALISLPVMIRYGYSTRYTTGVLAASGTITQLVPPSLVLVVLADQLGRSVGDMYKGAWGPSFLQILLFAAYTFILTFFRPKDVPAAPDSEHVKIDYKLILQCLKGIIPSAALIFIILGSMGGIIGINVAIVTPTEAGALGVMGAMLLAAMHKRLTWDLIKQALVGNMRITAMVIFILIGSRIFTLVFLGVDGSIWIEHMLTNLPGGAVGFLIVVNIFVFFLAFFLDFFEIAFIIVPLLAPVAEKLGINLIFFGVMLSVNMQTSFMHPPFGFALFYLRGICDTLFKNKLIKEPILTKDIYWGAIPWLVLQLVLVGLVVAFPEMVTAFLDKEIPIDIDLIDIILPESEQNYGDPVLDIDSMLEGYEPDKK